MTAFDSHAVEAFETNALDYVLKPADPVRMAKVIAKIKKTCDAGRPPSMAELLDVLGRMALPSQSQSGSSNSATVTRIEWLQVSVGSQIRMAHVNDVIYFEADTKYTRVVAQDFDGLIRTSLKELVLSLDATTFQQTHRATVVNRRFIHSVHRKGEIVEIELKGRSERLKVSTANHHSFRAM